MRELMSWQVPHKQAEPGCRPAQVRSCCTADQPLRCVRVSRPCTGTRRSWCRDSASKRCQNSRTSWKASSAVSSLRLAPAPLALARLLAACHSCITQVAAQLAYTLALNISWKLKTKSFYFFKPLHKELAWVVERLLVQASAVQMQGSGPACMGQLAVR